MQFLLLVESDGGSREMAYRHLQHFVLGEEGVEAISHLRTSGRQNQFYHRVLLATDLKYLEAEISVALWEDLIKQCR